MFLSWFRRGQGVVRPGTKPSLVASWPAWSGRTGVPGIANLQSINRQMRRPSPSPRGRQREHRCATNPEILLPSPRLFRGRSRIPLPWSGFPSGIRNLGSGFGCGPGAALCSPPGSGAGRGWSGRAQNPGWWRAGPHGLAEMGSPGIANLQSSIDNGSIPGVDRVRSAVARPLTADSAETTYPGRPGRRLVVLNLHYQYM